MRLLLALFCSVFFATGVALAQDAGATQGANAAQAPWESAYTAESFGATGGGQGPIREVFCDIAGLMEGSLGGLLASVAAVIAIGGAAFGDFTNAKSAMVVAIGGATILAGVSLYFGDMGCGGGGAGPEARATARSATPANAQSTDDFDPFAF